MFAHHQRVGYGIAFSKSGCVRALCVCVCVGGGCRWEMRHFLMGYRCDCVYGYVGVILDVNGEVVEGRNKTTNNNCAINRLKKLCFMMLHYVLLRFSLFV